MTSLKRSARNSIAGITLAAGIMLTGCASGTDFDAEAAKQLQSRVLSVTEAAAGGDHSTALTTLAELDVDARDALARNQITDARFESITAAATLVRADLEAAIIANAPPPPPAPAPAPPASSDSDNRSDTEGKDEKKNDEDEEKKDDKKNENEDKGKGKNADKGDND